MTIEQTHVITPDHLAREAVIYARQSTATQVHEHTESARVQFGLREKAIALGWPCPRIIDDDLGVSAGGFDERKGFNSLLVSVATRTVGIIFCVDASRLSRNSKDWAHLLEICGHFHTLIADMDQIYDLARPNDRLVIGIKGTVSEMELNIYKHRLRAGIESKAARGELRIRLPTGYAYNSDDNIAFDTDKQVVVALQMMFDQFELFTSVRQLAMWYRDSETRFPSQLKKQKTRWEIPTSSTLRNLLLHPIYTGAYVFGRRQTITDYADGQLVKRELDPRPVEEARVCIRDHHPAYISWEQYLANRSKIAENRPRWAMQQNRGAIRDGLALLVGLLRCAKCGSKIYVAYKKASALYFCDGGGEHGSRRCHAFGSKRIDVAVSDQLCQALQPHGLATSQKAAEISAAQHAHEVNSAHLQVDAAQYQADRAFEQFDLCDPKNRNVADTLEERLNTKLRELESAKTRLEEVEQTHNAVTDEMRASLQDLASDFAAVWSHPGAEPRLKKRILRAAIHEILVRPHETANALEVTIHWQGGVHTRVEVRKPLRFSGKPVTESLVQVVSQLAQTLSDADIARTLNMKKQTTARGLKWTMDRVYNFRKTHRIPQPKTRRSEDVLTMNQAVEYLGISHNGLLGLVRRGVVDTRSGHGLRSLASRPPAARFRCGPGHGQGAQDHRTSAQGGIPRFAARTLRRKQWTYVKSTRGGYVIQGRDGLARRRPRSWPRRPCQPLERSADRQYIGE